MGARVLATAYCVRYRSMHHVAILLNSRHRGTALTPPAQKKHGTMTPAELQQAVKRHKRSARTTLQVAHAVHGRLYLVYERG